MFLSILLYILLTSYDLTKSIQITCENLSEPTSPPTSFTLSPTENTPSPTGKTSSPTYNTPSPTDPTQSPTENTPSPTENTPSPTDATQSPTENTPSPITSEPEVIDISCTTRKGTNVIGVAATSSISCEDGETLVSCGIEGWDIVGGSTIISNECVAKTNSDDYQVSAQAVCCIFPDDAIVDVTTIISDPGDVVTAQCDINTVLTGCGAYYASGAYNQVQGSYTGSQYGSTPQVLQWIGTDNKCIAGSYPDAGVTANAQCLHISSLYTLECVTSAKYKNYDNFGTCQAGYGLFGCNAWINDTGTLDAYWIHNDDLCYVQMDGHHKLYANAICCRLIQHNARRLQDVDIASFDITSDTFGTNAPCLTMEITLATENLVPLNTAPDVQSNVFLIGKALANITGGYVSLPHIPGHGDEGEGDDEEVDVDSEWVWNIDAECMGDSQVDEVILPTKTYAPVLEGSVGWNDGLYVSVPLVTDDSVVYVFDVNELMLKISHVCDDALEIKGAIWNNVVKLGETAGVFVVANDGDRLKTLPFTDTIRLSPDTEYEIIFTSNAPDNCNLDDIDLSDDGNGRRRLSLSDTYTYNGIATQAKPNSCQLGQNLAKSDDMKTGVKTMCEATGDHKPQIEQGLFQRSAGDIAIGTYLVSEGSINIFDSTGTLISTDTSFPDVGIKSPCIAIDPETRRVFAVGGYKEDTGTAVSKITVYQFDDDTLKTGGVVTALNGWIMDKKRYGVMCKYWKESDTKEHIIVVSGMLSTTYEFSDKKQFYNDILLFEIPSSASDLNNWKLLYERKSKYIPKDRSIRASASAWVIASRLLIQDDHILYIVGGRTHKNSQKWISRFDLNDIVSKEGNAIDSGMELSANKAAPIIDKVDINMGSDTVPDIKSCYAVFAGQSYELGIAVETTTTGLPGLTVSHLQLFCNDNIDTTLSIDDTTSVQRRLYNKEEDIMSFTAFDREMIAQGRNRRRLSVDDDTDEISIKTYDYTLDDVWYNITVKFKLCYIDNEALQSAFDYYTNVIDDKDEQNGTEWDEYKYDTQDKILSVSQEAYEGWSNGFGDVKIFDLDILNITYLAEEEEKTYVCDVDTYTDTALRRRLMEESIPNTPCAQIRIDLETENVLPTNDDPHPASNIILIAQAFSNVTGAAASITMDYIFVDIQYDNGSWTSSVNASWTIDPDCIGDAQYNDTYFPQGIPFAPTLNANISVNESGLIRDFNFGLDGIWYSFHVEFELCFDDNHALKQEMEYYQNIIESKQENGEIWNDFVSEIGDKILDESLIAYYGWNDVGFGAVNVTDLEILSVNYEDIAFEEKVLISHPQPRKARFWAQIIGAVIIVISCCMSLYICGELYNHYSGRSIKYSKVHDGTESEATQLSDTPHI